MQIQPRLFLCPEHVRQLEGESPFDGSPRSGCGPSKGGLAVLSFQQTKRQWLPKEGNW